MSPVLVTLHAHPDDEAIFTGGTIARAVADGWRVVLVVATDGERGAPTAVADGGTVGAHRRRETVEAARVLGIHRVEFLGLGDSGLPEPEVGSPAHRATARALRAARWLPPTWIRWSPGYGTSSSPSGPTC